MSQNDSQCDDLSVQVIVNQQYCCATATTLTVWNKSLLFAAEGFTVFDSNGNLIFRVDADDGLLLMDALGKPLLTLHRKLPSLHQRWEGFPGNKVDGENPLFTVRRSSILPTNNCVEVFMNCGFICKPCADYEMEGSFSERCCTIYTNAPRMPAAKVKRKLSSTGTMLGKDVYTLYIERGVDQAFIMGIIIVLYHMECHLPLPHGMSSSSC